MVRKWTLTYLTKFKHLTICPFCLNGWLFVYELSDCGFESRCNHLNLRYRACFEQGAPWHSRNYRVQIHSKMRMRHDKNAQSLCDPCYIFEYVYSHTFHVNFLLKRHVPCDQRISCFSYHKQRTDSKPFSGLIGPRHMTTSLAVPHQSWMLRCSPHVL